MAGFYPANQGFLKDFSIALTDWIKAGPVQKAIFFNGYINRLVIRHGQATIKAQPGNSVLNPNS